MSTEQDSHNAVTTRALGGLIGNGRLVLVAITSESQKIVAQLRQGLNQPTLPAMLAGIHAMETRVDRLFRQALTTLFDDEALDTRLVIKWKEVYELIEEAINQTEKVTGIIETLIIKYA